MSIINEIKKRMEESRFCYAKEGGQGYVHKSKCICDKMNSPCQAKKDADRFHESFKDVEYGDIKRRNELVQELKSEFKNSQWWKDNVIE